jgi:hypothetical protein
MLSPEFLKRLLALRQQRQNNSHFQQWASQDAVQANANNKWTAAPWRGNAPQVIVYGPTNGKAYPNPAAALGAGVRDFTYQVPSGMNIDWSYWDQFKQPAPPSQKSVKPVGANHTTYYNPAPFSTSYRAPAYSQQEARPKNTSEKIAYEIEANRRSQAAGFASAAAQEIDANKRSQAAGFADAAAQEIDANRRAQLDGFANAAEKEIWHRNNKAQRKSGVIN